MKLNVRISDGAIVDVNQDYDPRFFTEIEVPDGTVPAKTTYKDGLKIDANGAVIPAGPLAAQPQYFWLDAGQPFGIMHTHHSAQVVFVISGSVNIVEAAKSTKVTAGQTQTIAAGLSHVIVGAENNSLFMNFHR